MKRFYKAVTTAPAPGGFAILLDGKSVKTPARASLVLPTRPLADAIAEEWRAQGEIVSPESMLLTRLANTAIDRIGPDREAIILELVAYGRHDLVCYRAVEPKELVLRESALWDPLLSWLKHKLGVELTTGSGLEPIAQFEEPLGHLAGVLRQQDAFGLAGLRSAANATGSIVISLGLASGHLDPRQAFAAASVDESYQAEKWGLDSEAEKRSLALASELEAADKFMRLART